MTWDKGFGKDNLIKLVDIVSIVISFLCILYTKDIIAKMISLLIMYTAMRNLFKEFVYPFK